MHASSAEPADRDFYHPGAGESGKSTVLKQMRVIHAGGFNKAERRQWRAVIFSNLVNAFQVIISAMQDQETDFEDEENMVSFRSTAQPHKSHTPAPLTLHSDMQTSSQKIPTLDPATRCP